VATKLDDLERYSRIYATIQRFFQAAQMRKPSPDFNQYYPDGSTVRMSFDVERGDDLRWDLQGGVSLRSNFVIDGYYRIWKGAKYQ